MPSARRSRHTRAAWPPSRITPRPSPRATTSSAAPRRPTPPTRPPSPRPSPPAPVAAEPARTATARMGCMRYIIIGAGAVGGTIGGCLFQGGHDVVLVARGPHLDALRAHGLRLATPAGTYQLGIRAVGGPAEVGLREGDVLILAVKGQHT